MGKYTHLSSTSYLYFWAYSLELGLDVLSEGETSNYTTILFTMVRESKSAHGTRRGRCVFFPAVRNTHAPKPARTFKKVVLY